MRRLFAVAACLVLAGISTQAAAGGGPLATGFVENGDFNGPDSALAYARVRSAGATFIRIYVHWDQIAPSENLAPWAKGEPDPRDPDNPNYRWATLDASVSRARANKLTPIVSILNAPAWAWGATSSPEIGDGSVKPSLTALATFATAAAKRYSGSVPGHPRVKYWQLWNEPNLSIYLRPQFVGNRLVSASWYRGMTNAFYAAIHAVRADNVVIAGGQSPFAGNGPTYIGASPMRFMSEMLCMSEGDRPHPTCSDTVHFDIWAHHPYTAGGPTHKALNPGDVSLGDLPAMKRLLDAAVKAHHVVSRQKMRFWVTEFSWDSQPGDPKGVPARLHARWVSEALYRMWQSGVSLVTWFNIRDDPFVLDSPNFCQCGFWVRGSGGLATDKPKLSLRAFSFPFVAFSRPGGGVTFWGRTPDSHAAALEIEQRTASGWVSAASVNAGQRGIFAGTISGPRSRSATLRARNVATNVASVPFSLVEPPDMRICAFGTC